MDQEQLLEKVKVYVESILAKDSSGHGMDHINRVVKLAKELAATEDCDYFKVVVAAYLHDVMDDKLVEDVSEARSNLVLFLSELGFIKNEINDLFHIIDNVSFSNHLGKQKVELSIEAQIVQDADRLDAIGAIGIARTFYYGGFAGHKMHDSTILPRKLQDKKEYRVNQTVINHFYEKLLLLPELLNTKKAQAIGQQRKQVMMTFLADFESEYLGKDYK